MVKRMNIPTYLLGAIIFLIGQTTGAIWWASSLSAEVERQGAIQGKAIPELQAEAKQCGIEIHNLKKLTADQESTSDAVKSVDVLRYRLSAIESTLDKVLATKIR